MTGPGVVSRIYTDLAVVDVTPDGFRVVELAPGITFEEVESKTGAPILPPHERRTLNINSDWTNKMTDVFICDGIRTPVGRYGGSISSVRADDLGAIPITALMERNPGVDWASLDDVMLGCANQSGEDNRNVARMSGLLAGLPQEVPACTINRLCGSGLNAVGSAANAIKTGEGDLMIAGGVESMSRAPFVIGKAESAFGRTPQMYDSTMGWRFINKKLDQQYGTDPMPKTAENLAEEYAISREDQDRLRYGARPRRPRPSRMVAWPARFVL